MSHPTLTDIPPFGPLTQERAPTGDDQVIIIPTAILAEASYFSHVLKILASSKIISKYLIELKFINVENSFYMYLSLSLCVSYKLKSLEYNTAGVLVIITNISSFLYPDLL